MGALEAALFRPQLGYYEGLIEEAAALMERLANNHPLIDGNKRVAFFMTDTFLRMNGQYIDCDNTKTCQDFMNWFETGQFRFGKLRWWLSSVVKPVQKRLLPGGFSSYDSLFSRRFRLYISRILRKSKRFMFTNYEVGSSNLSECHYFLKKHPELGAFCVTELFYIFCEEQLS